MPHIIPTDINDVVRRWLLGELLPDQLDLGVTGLEVGERYQTEAKLVRLILSSLLFPMLIIEVLTSMRVMLAEFTTGPLIVRGPLLSLTTLFLAPLYFDRGFHLVAGTTLELRARRHLPA